MSHLALAFEDSVLAGIEHGLEDAREEAIRRSSGPYSLAELAAMDHPYARRHGTPLLDPSIVNDQTGGFRSRWRSPEIIRFGPEVSGRIVNDADVADWLQNGTPTMVPRPIAEAVEIYGQESVERRTEDALQRWASDNYLY